MHARCNADNRAFAHGAQKVALELDGGETLRSFGQVGEGPVAAGGIRDGNDRRRHAGIRWGPAAPGAGPGGWWLVPAR